jgi:hypothetical protein
LNAFDSDQNLEFAKWVAVLCMVVDHVALAGHSPWRPTGMILGQVSMPLFSILIVMRLRQATGARARRYLWRLLMWGVLTQPVFFLLTSGWGVFRLNALFTLAGGVLLIYLASTKRVWLAVAVAGGLIAGTSWLDWGAWMPIAQVLAWLALWRWPLRPWLAIGIVASAGEIMNQHFAGQFQLPMLFPTFAILWALLVSPNISASMPKLPGWAFYGFYPFHLGVIWTLHGPY